ncbi:MAG TPA: outer membrane beta-barrel protein [Nitrospirota bacterium]|nr:outer membrane beta-barrel protein [Nitrospirota bacterium]
MKTTRAYFGRQELILPILFSIAIAMPATLAAAPASEKNDGYFVLKGGYYYPSESTLSLNDFEDSGTRTELERKNGFDGEIAFGHYFFPIFGIEFGAGYFESKSAPPAEPGQTRLKVVPVQLSGKLFLPLGPFEPYAEAGIGAYFTKFEVQGNLGSFNGTSRVTYGIHWGAGLNFNFTDSFFMGLEGRYIKAKPEYGGQPVRLDGYTATLNLGFRY